MPKRKQKKYNRPKKLYDKPRIEEENILVKKYGLKNKKEIWRADFAIGKIRDIAKKLITASEDEKSEFIERQKAKGFEVENIADVLGLDKEDYLKRRLQSVVVSKGLIKTPRQARQFIAHRHLTVDGKVINSPGHLTTVEEEAKIEIKIALPVIKETKEGDKPLIEKAEDGEEGEEPVVEEGEETTEEAIEEAMEEPAKDKEKSEEDKA